MKKIIATLILFIVFTNFDVDAQIVDKMNKNELKFYNSTLLVQIDSLNKQIAFLENSEKQLLKSLKNTEEKNTLNLEEIQNLNNLIKQTKEKAEILLLEKEKEIQTLKDSNLNLQQSLRINSTIKISDSTDFLNTYYFKPFSLENHSFSLVLSKVILGNNVPEILPANAFTYWGVKPNEKLKDDTNFIDIIFPQSLDYFNSKLPNIEFLKNKLITIINKTGKEESFIFFISKESNNNGRDIFQFDLTSQDNNNERNSGNLIWRFYAIENEVYLGLNYDQLSRFNSELKFAKLGVEAYSESSQKVGMAQSFNSSYRQTTTGNGVYLSRKKDIFMPEEPYINPTASNIVFLFKLK